MLMLNLNIDVNAFNRARTRLDRRLTYWKTELPYRVALLYIEAVRRAITTQHFPYHYEPHSPNYKKKANVDKFWIHSSRTLDEIMTTPISTMASTGDYTSMGFRFSPRVTDIIHWMEYGTEQGRRMPARPLFSPLYDQARTEFRRLTGWALSDLQHTWRRW